MACPWVPGAEYGTKHILSFPHPATLHSYDPVFFQRSWPELWTLSSSRKSVSQVRERPWAGIPAWANQLPGLGAEGGGQGRGCESCRAGCPLLWSMCGPCDLPPEGRPCPPPPFSFPPSSLCKPAWPRPHHSPASAPSLVWPSAWTGPTSTVRSSCGRTEAQDKLFGGQRGTL